LGKGDKPIARLIVTYSCLVDILHHISQVAARVAKLVWGVFGTQILERGDRGGSATIRRNGFLKDILCDYCAISNHSATICDRTFIHYGHCM